MEELGRTLDVYERDADAFVEKYRSESVAARFGDEFLAALPGDRVLDVGCGPGADAETFADRGLSVTGLDLSGSFLAAARSHVPGGSFVRGDMRRLPLDGEAFDGVWSCASLLHVPRPAVPATLREFRRVLAADGVCYLSLKRGDGGAYDDDGRYFERYRQAEVESLLEAAGLSPARFEVTDRWVGALAAPA
jgi:ubiquinone/menaquinone biosynthesis C-methylase UbiE